MLKYFAGLGYAEVVGEKGIFYVSPAGHPTRRDAHIVAYKSATLLITERCWGRGRRECKIMTGCSHNLGSYVKWP